MHNSLIYETSRCLQCYNAPCEQACPVHIPIPRFIRMLKSGNVIGAAEEIKSANTLANICGQICPEEIFCQSVCCRAQIYEPVAIRQLHDFATRFESEKGFSEPQIPTSLHEPVDVAVIGAGPAGLSCAFELRKMGTGCRLFDRFEKSGGVPAHIIPSWRLAFGALDYDLQFLHRYLPAPQVLTKTVSLAEFKKKYRIIFIATGLWLDRWLEIPGEEMPDVYHAIDYLSLARSGAERLAAYKNVVVIGGGNVSLDVAATAKKLGAEQVLLTYRSSPAEMKTWQAEKKAAQEAGVRFGYQLQPVEITGSGKVEGVKFVTTKLGEPDERGRRSPQAIPGSEEILKADCVIVAFGFRPNPAGWLSDFNIRLDERNRIEARDNSEFSYQTSNPKIFAGGDMVRGSDLVVTAVYEGRQAAEGILDYLKV